MLSAPSRPQPHSRSNRLRTGLRLIPLVCAAWAGNAAAIDVIYQGPPGGSGLTGPVAGAPGGNGLAAPSALQVLFSNDPANTLYVTGGKGGDGGNGGPGNASVMGGPAGAGGAGADTTADLTATLLAAPASLTVVGTGGLGGNAGQPGAGFGGPGSGLGATGGNGGAVVSNATLITAGGAFSQVAATATGGQGGLGSAGLASGNGGAATSNARADSSGAAPLHLSSSATGGAGGAATDEDARAGDGGAATATNGLSGDGSGVPDLTMLTTATGGRGGDANLDFTSAPHAIGGNGGSATVSHSAAYAGNTLNLSQTATGGAGGDAIFGRAGNGGNAWSTISVASGAALTVNVAGTAIGGHGGEAVGSPFDPGESGSRGGGGSANSQLSLNAGTAGWNAEITGTSTAIAGMPGNSAFVPDGGSADAVSTVQGTGRVTSIANATGQFGSQAGGYANAQAVANSNYIAIARANTTAGGAQYSAGAAARARAEARSLYFASADAVANSGSGRFGDMEPASASAEATVNHYPGAAPVSPAQPSEARAHALSSGRDGVAAARSTYTDQYGSGAAVTTSATTGQPAMLYTPEATTAANIGGAAYAPWDPQQGISSAVISYASALPTAASVAPLIASSAEVAAAFAGADTLAAGTMAGAFFPMTGSAQLKLPFSTGSHLLLGLVQPIMAPGIGGTFSFSVTNGGTSLYSGNFTTEAQANAVFNGHAFDLGVVNANSLDLLLTFTLEGGIYGFSYLIGQGGALAPVPEPGSWMLLMLGLALLGWRLHIRKFATVSRRII